MMRERAKLSSPAPAARRGRFGDALTLLAPIVLGLLLTLGDTAPVAQIRSLLFDHYQRLSPRPWNPNLPVRIIDIDDASLARYGQWPWPRDTIAQLTSKLAAAAPAAIVFDILFAEEDRFAPERLLERLPPSPERDALAKKLGTRSPDPFAAAIANAPVVLALALTTQPSPFTGVSSKSGFVELGDRAAPALPAFPRAILPLPALAAEARGLGAINYLPDRDLIVRNVPLVFALATGDTRTLLPSLDAEALRVAQGLDTIVLKSTRASGETSFSSRSAILEAKIGEAEIATQRDGTVRVRFAGHQPARFIPAWRIIEGDLPLDEIRDRILFVGASAAALSDLRSTPIDTAVPGVEIHAETIEHVVTGSRLTRLDYAEGLEALVLIALALLTGMAAARLRPAGAASVTAIALAGLFVASWLAFTRGDLLFDPLTPGLTALATFGAVTLRMFRRTESDRRQVRDAFSRYLAPAVVDRLAADPSQLKLGGEARELTILFCDARDFTAHAERLDAESVVSFLNALHTPLTAAVLSHNGTIDKFVGDGLMAFWNAPLDDVDHATHACAAALSMVEAIPSIDARLSAAAQGRKDNPPRVSIGIGIDTGEAFVGNMGSEQRFDYSAVGDHVNTAARLEAATKTLGLAIIVSDATARAARGFDFVDLGDLALRGKSEKVRAWALHGRSGSHDESFGQFVELHRRALKGDLDSRAAARLHPLGEGYSGFYDRLDENRDPAGD
ncbi:MAG: adenylate/guanylate cyclase protein [Hyphomicrobiales bacterium]|nr:adenylate/guanylate cyclase protein [Hyphomicrobiales bacterium]